VFSSLGTSVEGVRVLDLFAGTGAMGIEALSRGAAEATFVDSSARAIRTIHDNLARTRLAGRVHVRRSAAARAIRDISGPFDLVLLDPPYALDGPELDRLLDELAGQELVAPAGRLVLTRPARSYTPVIPVHWSLERRLSYGDTEVLVLSVSEQPDQP